jgi:hypothetical protein
MLRLRLDVRLALLCIKTLKYNPVRSTRFWNNLHQVRTVKRLECKLFKSLKGLSLVANIGYDWWRLAMDISFDKLHCIVYCYLITSFVLWELIYHHKYRIQYGELLLIRMAWTVTFEQEEHMWSLWYCQTQRIMYLQ